MSSPSETQVRSAPKTTTISIAGPAGALELLIDEPGAGEPGVDESRSGSSPAGNVAVICHPHPLFGGNMTNKVVHTLARTFNDLGLPAVRFNFRGVGKSAGTHDDGEGETEDALAVMEWTRERWPGAELWLAGFSFGAAIALRASLRSPVTRLITVAPAIRWLQQVKAAPATPWLIVQGDQDELVNVEAVRSWVAKLTKPPTLEVLAGGEHFFHGRLNDLRDAINAWLERVES
ncbi:MAG TPA: alpha/beta fold hydrolase [Steroidobacteraceae bacterium]|nr:alpha/beta fold hydrolase [Steroidobacteraceae bacterium]